MRCLSLFALALSISTSQAFDDYKLGPDSSRHPDAPIGKVTKMPVWKSMIFADTERDWWIYVPAQYDGKTPAALMVFQDGGGFISDTGSYRAPIVFDNLIHRKEMPITIGVFINPGNVPSSVGKGGRSNRSFEYDTLSNQYATFLEKEILPEVEKSYKITKDPAKRAICGNSSGGICAFTAAWERPDLFGKVLSHIGSFTNIRGGDVYPGMIRKTERKPIKVLLQDGSHDLDNLHGNWPMANLQMAAALKFMKYEYRLEFGDGAHSGKHGGAIFPDSLRWLWSDHK